MTESCDYYCNMKYRLPFSTLEALQSSQCITPNQRTDATMLDLYCGCGAMSTGLCMGAQLSGLNLVTVRHFFSCYYNELVTYHCCS